MTQQIGHQKGTDDMGVSRPIVVGLIVIALFFGGLGGWAALAPLGSAAIASGVVSVEGSRKTVQHFEGGIVAEILVKDGDLVEKGQPLIRLERTQAEASLKLIYGRKMVSLAEMARLLAERDNSGNVVFSDWLTSRADDVNTAKAMEGQLHIFDARRLARKGQINILEQKISQINEEIQGLNGQVV
ncbi:MAG: biotin/lipoyl-binding protein, partial [Sneathiella sp.]|nr:biotin/lipoyl-binding protein [Sneathiella sp.]